MKNLLGYVEHVPLHWRVNKSECTWHVQLKIREVIICLGTINLLLQSQNQLPWDQLYKLMLSFSSLSCRLHMLIT